MWFPFTLALCFVITAFSVIELVWFTCERVRVRESDHESNILRFGTRLAFQLLQPLS